MFNVTSVLRNVNEPFVKKESCYVEECKYLLNELFQTKAYVVLLMKAIFKNGNALICINYISQVKMHFGDPCVLRICLRC